MRFIPALRSVRAPFLVLPPACIFLGASLSLMDSATLDIPLLLLILAGALLAHISVNTLNEYQDFRSGLDLRTERTPFSGGSGALPAHQESASLVLAIAITALLLTALIGLYLVWRTGPGILPIGLGGLLLIILYTRWINRSPWLCLVAPGLGFGGFMVVGTQYVLTGNYHLTTLLAATVPFLLANNLLLLNQFPDIEADRSVGRNHLPIAYGTDTSSRVYGLLVLAAAGIIGVSVLLHLFPSTSLLALLPMPLAWFAYRGARHHGPALGRHPQYLGANVAVSILSPLLLGISFLLT